MKRHGIWRIAVAVLSAMLMAAGSSCKRLPGETGAAGVSAPTETPPAAPAAPPKGPEVDLALAFVQEVQAQQYDAAYRRLSPRSRESLPQAQWAGVFAQSGQPPSGALPNEFLRYALEASDYAIGAVSLQGEQGSAAVTLRGTKPMPVCLVREGGKWWVDWTDEGQVRAALEQNLSAFTGQAGNWQTMALMYGGDGGRMTGLASPLWQGCKAVSSVQEGERAVVKVVGTGTVQAFVPVQKTQGRWVANWQYAALAPAGTDQKATSQAVQEQLAEARGRASTAECQSNLKQLALGMLMYAQDYDECFPPADRWSDVIYPYIKNREILKCPGDPKHEYGYAFNRALSFKRLGEIPRPAETPLLFDSTLGKKNAADEGTSWPSGGRHAGGNSCAFTDGHVKWFREKPNFALQSSPAQ